MTAWYVASVSEFLAADAYGIANQLAAEQAKRSLNGTGVGLSAWLSTVATMKQALNTPDAACWTVLFEYELARVGKRADVLIVTDRAVFVLEFKTGVDGSALAAARQADDYAQDLHDFHAGCRDVALLPVAVTARNVSGSPSLPLLGSVHPAQFATPATLLGFLQAAHRALPPLSPPKSTRCWANQPYRPVPGIVEAARMAFARQAAPGINTTLADRGDLAATTAAIVEHVLRTEAARERRIIFVTGIPGAGKTRCGLGVAFETTLQDRAVFLTGNPSLVHVFREALVRDAVDRGSQRKAAEQAMEQRIQALPHFRDTYASTEHAPAEHVIIVDEAQRSWSADHAIRKTRDRPVKLSDSEAGHILDAMARVPDWSTIICLVGGGQEIHDGEGGLAEWSAALVARPEWQVTASSFAFGSSDPRQRLAADLRHDGDEKLHLAASIRSLRSTAQPDWVNAVLRSDVVKAHALAVKHTVPVFLTRDLAALRQGLRQRARGLRRVGLLVSSGAARMRAEGLGVELPHMDKSAVGRWFLDQWPADVRASDALEVAANEFSCQGLELDYAGLAWGGDLVRTGAAWRVRRFRGTDWEDRHQEDAISNRINTYRVLLTRARYETIIWVPRGDATDRTRNPAEFDAIAEYLAACGAGPLPEFTPPLQTEPALLL